MEKLHPAINVPHQRWPRHRARPGHGRGLQARRATLSEIDAMKVIVERGMKDGAVGLERHRCDPGFYATTDELVALASVIKSCGGFYSSHVRDEENEVLAAWSEAIEIGRRAGVPVEISHMKLASAPVWGQAAKGLALVDAARRAGQDVTGDWYPYPMLALVDLRADPAIAISTTSRSGNEASTRSAAPPDVLISSYKPDPSWIGRTLADLAAERHIDAPHLIVQMIKDAGTSIGVIVTAMDERDMTAIFAHPATLICSDGELDGRHPRGYGRLPRVLARYVREQHVVTVEDAIAKMTSRSARKLGLIDRGTRRDRDRRPTWSSSIPRRSPIAATPANPAQSPAGIDYVIVNGEIVLDHGARSPSARPRPRAEASLTADHCAFDHFPLVLFPITSHLALHFQLGTSMRLIRATGALLDSLLDDTFPLWGDGLTRKGYGHWNIAQERTDWGTRHLRRFALMDGARVLSSAKQYDLSLAEGTQVSAPRRRRGVHA